MKLTKKALIPEPHFADRYYLEITLMSGDADSFDKIELGPFREVDLDDLEEIMSVLQRMKDAFPNGRGGGGRDNYDNVPGFTEWFEGIEREESPWDWEAEPKWWKYLGDSPEHESWPVDKFDYETHANPYKWKVYFYEGAYKAKFEMEVSD